MSVPTNYLDPATLARLSGLELKARRIVEGYLSGLHRSPHQGFSAEFAEHREYVPGDDLRYMDWKVYGKRDRYYLKQFEEETNFVCHVLVDASPSMHYRSGAAAWSKLDEARHVAAALSYLVLRQQDAVGLATFGGAADAAVRPAGQPGHLKQIVHLLESLETGAAPLPPGGTRDPAGNAPDAIAAPLHELAERLRTRAVVIVLSDFFGDLESIVSALRHFQHRRHDVSVMQIIDPAEQDFPFEEPTLFRGLEAPLEEFVEPRAVRRAYRQEFERFRQALESGCRQLGIDYVLLRTDRALDVALSGFLVRRTRRAMRT